MARPNRETRNYMAEREDEESSSSDEEDQLNVDDVEFVRLKSNVSKRPITISLRGKKECKVCKKHDHSAGFVGSVYVDCPNKPCYLCKLPGHTTATCPHKSSSNRSVTQYGKNSSGDLFHYLFQRELQGSLPMIKKFPPVPNRVDMAMLRLHERRINVLEFHSHYDHFVISGDKKGHIGVWNFHKGHEKNVYSDVHFCQINSIKFHSSNDFSAFTASTDGKICLTDLETGFSENLLVLNSLDHGDSTTNAESFFGMDVNSQLHSIFSADDVGNLYMFDIRNPTDYSIIKNAHKPCSKISSLHFNPRDNNIFISSGNDYMAHVWDVRMMNEKIRLATLKHPRVINSSFFSPVTGCKILTTCQDNRLRVWDSLYGNLSEPSREIVHSHDFHRYVTAFRAEWDPKDPHERVIVCGRFISDDYQGVALHPIDFMDASTGSTLCEIYDHNLTTISAVNKPHPRLDLLATGSSRSIYIWKHVEAIEEEEEEEELKRKSKDQCDVLNGGGSSIQFFDALQNNGNGKNLKRKGGGNDKRIKKNTQNGVEEDDKNELEKKEKSKKRFLEHEFSLDKRKKKAKLQNSQDNEEAKSTIITKLVSNSNRMGKNTAQSKNKVDDNDNENIEAHSYFDKFKSNSSASNGEGSSRLKRPKKFIDENSLDVKLDSNKDNSSGKKRSKKTDQGDNCGSDVENDDDGNDDNDDDNNDIDYVPKRRKEY